MAVYDDYDGVYFTIQALRIYHELCQTDQIEFIVLDNNPTSTHGKETKKFIENAIKGKYIPIYDKSSSFTKYKIPEYASGKYILGLDCHVILEPNGINNLLEYYKNNPETNNLIQGPLWYDDLKNISTNFSPVYRGDMFGIWETQKNNYDKGKPFEIPMQGMGLFSFRKDTWKGIPSHFRGFGAEEGYIQGKFAQWGGKTICLPNLKWNHRFGRPNRVPYPLSLEDRIFNYFIGCLDLYHDIEHPFIKQTYDHFLERKVSKKTLNSLLLEAFQKIENKQLYILETV